MYGYFQFYEMNLIDTWHYGDVLPQYTFCHFSLSRHRFCQLIHFRLKHVHAVYFQLINNLVV